MNPIIKTLTITMKDQYKIFSINQKYNFITINYLISIYYQLDKIILRIQTKSNYYYINNCIL